VVSVSTSSPYSPGEEALIYVSVSYGGHGVAASVTAVITLPNGHKASGHVTTGSNGQAIFGYIIPRVAGTYKVRVTATASGYTTGVGTTSFTVT